jgi:anti-sigma regulatory factor (Ser/Thr protein kinase)
MAVECDFAGVRPAVDKVGSFIEEHGCAQEARCDFELAVAEGCNNAIKHTWPGSKQKPVVVEVNISRGEIEVRITDHGPGFSWPKIVQLPKPEYETGRGLYLIRRLMDSACYVRGPDHNTLVLRRSRRSA